MGDKAVGILDRFVRAGIKASGGDNSRRVWRVQFTPTGRVYTYVRTKAELQDELSERLATRHELPHLVELSDGKRFVEVKIGLESERGERSARRR